MKRWYVIGFGDCSVRRLAEHARDAVRQFCEEGIPYPVSGVRSVRVETTGELVPEGLWR